MVAESRHEKDALSSCVLQSIIAQRTTSVKSINLHIIRKLIKYSLKNVAAKTVFTVTVFEIFLLEGMSVLGPGTQKNAKFQDGTIIQTGITLKQLLYKNLLSSVRL